MIEYISLTTWEPGTSWMWISMSSILMNSSSFRSLHLSSSRLHGLKRMFSRYSCSLAAWLRGMVTECCTYYQDRVLYCIFGRGPTRVRLYESGVAPYAIERSVWHNFRRVASTSEPPPTPAASRRGSDTMQIAVAKTAKVNFSFVSTLSV